ncbi:MAG: AbgT family transporter, partial [Cetobacterium sp.]
MEQISINVDKQKESLFIRIINSVEKAGNKLPHPFFLFVYLSMGVLLLSFFMSGISVTYTTAASNGGELKEITTEVVNLLSKSYIKDIFKNLVSIYISFAPLGLVMVMMLAIGYIQCTGFFDAFMKKALLGAPTYIITFSLAVIGVCANMASNAGIIFGATIGAALFASMKRNPILGALTGYAAAHGGFSANLIPSGTDVLVAGITGSAAAGMNIVAPTHPLTNYFFMIIATFTTALAVTFVTEKIMPKVVKNKGIEIEMVASVSENENKGLKLAMYGFVIFSLAMLALSLPQDSFFRAADGSLVPESPLIDSIVTILFIFFVIIGTSYGIGARTVKEMADVPRYMGTGIKDSISFCVVALPAAMFIKFFNDSKIANILAVNGANFLESLKLNGIPLALSFIVLVILCNLFMSSASSKWLILAPIFVPMFFRLGFSPALTQLLYRIGDSVSNPIAPINFFLPIILGIMNKYKREGDSDYGLGTLISYMLPYSIF